MCLPADSQLALAGSAGLLQTEPLALGVLVQPMASEIQPQPQARKPCLVNKIDAFQDVVSSAVIIPKEDGIISVSDDR